MSLKPFVPPGGYIWKGRKSRNWSGHYPPFQRHSASWAMYGMTGSAVVVLRELWRRHAEANPGLEMPKDCAVGNLFDDSFTPVPLAAEAAAAV